MAEEGSEISAANSSSTPNWRELSANPLSSWTNMNPWHRSNASNLSIDNSSHELVESSSAVTELSGEAASESDNHLWSQVLLSVGTAEDLRSSHDGENFLEALSSKNLTTELFEPACDYLKKSDNCWEFTNQTSYIEKHLNSYGGSLMEHERLPNSSDFVSNWSIAPPDPRLDHQITPKMRTLSLNSSIDRCLDSSLSQMKHEPHNFSSYPNTEGLGNINSGYQHQGMEASETPFLKSSNDNCCEYQMGHNNSVMRDNKGYYGMSDVPWANNTRAFSNHISFGGCLNQPLVELQAPKPCLEGSNSPDSMKQGNETTSSARGNGRGTGTVSEAKKKRSDYNSDNLPKKPKHETSAMSSSKIQPKVKLGDRITALQQIVSPFGKTDTASVLLEAIGYIKFLHEQVQLLSNPYMKLGANKDHPPWGSLERKDKSVAKHDLKSRGLCLVPISCTPRVYRENTGSDYWTPTYRGCLYR